ncbi:CHAT domain-containing protein [Hwanghaeella grinnelliae]|uniref:CHAT domain-containing protein n=1 Tax=Hwanghaeella grinnelliae TaxID=2500179 RepID=A0A3S2VPV2_9PROT|nr:CHAT domain-containing protein [Hwanghaeella grinnelliae]RVU38839.1 CHAT domain-containing protein [Hwanghaeella grinnelliae]
MTVRSMLGAASARLFRTSPFLALVLVLPLAGCVTATQKARVTGQTQGVVADAASGGIDYAALEHGEHLMICTILLNARHYKALDDCIAVLERRKAAAQEGFTTGLVAVTPAYYESSLALIKSKRANELGDYDEAARSARRAVEIGQGNDALVQVNSGYSMLSGLLTLGMAAPNDPDSPYQQNLRRIVLADAYSAMATAQYGLGDMQALEGVRNALKQIYSEENLSEQNPLTRHLKHSLSHSYFLTGDYKQSYDWLVRDDRSALLQLLDGVGEAYMTIGVLATPVSEAMAQAIAGASTEDLNFINNLPFAFRLCVTALEVGRNDEARNCFETILNEPLSRPFGEYRFGTYYGLARIARDAGDPAKAIGYLSNAIDLIEGQRASILTEGHKLGFISDKQDLYRMQVDLLLETGDVVGALEYAERSKSRALIDLLAAREGGEAGVLVAGDNAAALPAQVAARDRLLEELSSIEQEARIGLPNRDRGASLAARRAEVLDRLRQSDRRALPLVRVDKPDLAALRSHLRPDEVLLFYYGDENGLVGFLYDQAGVSAKRLDSNNLDVLVEVFREQLARKTGGGYRTHAIRLYERLIAPFAAQVAGKSLAIVPHGKLHYLPFAALYDGDAHLAEKHALRILPSASVLDYIDRGAGGAGAMLALGNPALNDPSLDLPGAEREAQAIAAEWNGLASSGGAPARADLYLRNQATETVVKTGAQGYGVLHLASHGVFDGDKPLASRLLLSADDRNDGVLTVREIYDLTLSADLVTLSACETGLGEVANGDDVIGLTRGFLYAGAGSIVSSLWTVSDDATEVLMKAFYRNLQTMPKTEALRRAQLETAAQYPHPYFWSAFQISGAV